MHKEITHEELLKKVEALNPLLIKAVDEVDVSLIEEFKKLSIEQRISRATGAAITLASIVKQ